MQARLNVEPCILQDNLASILFIRCNQATQDDGANDVQTSEFDLHIIIYPIICEYYGLHVLSTDSDTQARKIWQMRKVTNSSLRYNDILSTI